MAKNNDIERILAETPKPKLKEGSHRLQLKYSLMNQMRKEKRSMTSWKKTLAWAACLVIITAVVSWAGQKIYKKFTFIVSESDVVTESVTMSSDDPGYTEGKAREQYEEIQKLKASGKGELLEVKETDYGKVYIYKFVLSDGEVIAWGTHRPLGSSQSRKLGDQEILDLFAEGKGKLIEEKVLDSGEKIYLYKMTRQDGTTFMFGSDIPMKSEQQ